MTTASSSRLLKIDVSPRGEHSLSRKLGASFANAWIAQHGAGSVTERDLSRDPPSFVDLPWIAGAFSAPDQHTAEHKAALKLSDTLIAELTAADHLLITTPMYNFSIPAVLKAWIDHVVRVGVTFAIADGNFKGLVEGKKATVIITSGSPLAGTPYDLETPYLKQILGFIGITDVEFVQAGGGNAVSYGKVSEADFLAPFAKQAEALAAA